MNPLELVEEEVCDSSAAAAAAESQPKRACSPGGGGGGGPALGGTWPQLPVVPRSLHYSHSSSELAHAEEEAVEPGTPPHQLSPVVQASIAALQSATSLMQELGELQQPLPPPDAFARQQQPLLLPTPQLSPELRGAPPPPPAWLAAALLQLQQPLAGGGGAYPQEASSPERTIAPSL
ncbi:hypothetical protein ABPG75_002893 [Micractinium tetrahymenae]